ncbi:UNVERIFIED_CONTAM: hypothetical protein RMT77_012428 [Armadillidium vulgare]
MDPQTETFCDASPSQNNESDSDDSAASYHSLTEQLESINVEDVEFSKPEEMRRHSPRKGKYSKTGDPLQSNIDNEDIPKKRNDKYFIDEDYLKDVFSTLTEEEIQTNHDNVLEMKNKANELFKQGSFEEASGIYTEALRLCPLTYEKDRAILYANRAASRSKIDLEEEKKGAVEDCSKAITLDPNYFKAILRRANLHRMLENLDESLKDYQRLLELDPRNSEAQQAVMTLPRQIEERNEKLKEEMMGKLKDLGNMILKPFGLSTNNFQLNQNPDGGYNINFQQKQ